MKTIEPLTQEFIKYNWTGLLKPIETIFYEFDLFYGLKGKQQLDRCIIDGGLELAILFLKQKYNSIPYEKRNFIIV